MRGDVIPHHGRRVFEHVGKQSAAQKRLVVRLDHDVITNRNRELSLCPDVGTECRVVRGFVMAETGIPYKLEGQVFRHIMKNAGICLADSKNQLLQQDLELCRRLSLLCLMSMIPFTVIVPAEFR